MPTLKGKQRMSAEDYPILFEDANGQPWRRKRISRTGLQAIQAKERELDKLYDERHAVKTDETTDDDDAGTENVSQNKLFDVRLAAIYEFCASVDGSSVDLDNLDTGEAQHLFQGFWRNVWGLDPKGNLL